MTLRSLLLTGTLVSLAIGHPALALNRALPTAISSQLAQNNVDCPEGTTCAPAGAPPSGAAPDGGATGSDGGIPLPEEPGIDAAPIPEVQPAPGGSAVPRLKGVTPLPRGEESSPPPTPLPPDPDLAGTPLAVPGQAHES